MLPFHGGTERPLSQLKDELVTAADRYRLEGITLLGGEPFSQATVLSEFARFAQSRSLSVMVFSGFLLSQLQAASAPGTAELLQQTDLLVDGPYIAERPEAQRRWIGSTNQQLHFLTGRYSASDPRFWQRNTIELQWVDGELRVNGFPLEGRLA